MAKDSVVVYWAMYAHPDHVSRVNLIWKAPVPLMSTFEKSSYKDSEYLRCSAFRAWFKNAYAMINPVDSTVHIERTPELRITGVDGYPAWEIPTFTGMTNQPAIDYCFSWIFFSEETLILEQTPPYLHKTSDREGGTMTAGAFDISKWFRPTKMAYLLWKDTNSISVKKGEPIVYWNFLTDKKIILQPFELTAEIYNLCEQTLQHKQFFHNEPLSVVYQRFVNGNRHKRLLKLIKENLL